MARGGGNTGVGGAKMGIISNNNNDKRDKTRKTRPVVDSLAVRVPVQGGGLQVVEVEMRDNSTTQVGPVRTYAPAWE
jgi:hypothetical protein